MNEICYVNSNSSITDQSFFLCIQYMDEVEEKAIKTM